jgi:NADPH:quinone reductase-like Zn-dependent oxidoreductase
MQAAVVSGPGQAPVLSDFPAPVAAAGEVRVAVAAAAVSAVAKARASGRHYSAGGSFPFVAGIDGVGRRDDGRRVYFALPRPPFGSFAETAVVAAPFCVAVPEDLDDVTAAAIANPGMSSWAALTERARLRRGETVLVNGATGTSGRLAVQIARHLGAGRVVATGRDGAALAEVEALGADAIIRLGDDREALEASFRRECERGVDVVVDYLWGASAESLLIAAAKAGSAAPLRFVQVGSVAGPDIVLPSAVLRAAAIELMGSGTGSVALPRLVAIAGELLGAVGPAKLKIACKPVPFADFDAAWPQDVGNRRTVFVMDGRA